MERDDNVNGGTKRLAACVVMTLGVGGALLFRQDPAAAPRPDTAGGDLLVRRSNGPPAGAADLMAAGRGSFALEPNSDFARGDFARNGGAQFTGTIDPFRNPGTQAAAERRLTADYGRAAPPPTIPTMMPNGAPPPAFTADAAARFPYATGTVGPGSSGPAPSGSAAIGGASSSSAPFPPSRYFIDPTSEAERTPLNNVSMTPRLPAEYPAAGGATGEGSTAGPSSSAEFAPMTPLGASQGAASSNSIGGVGGDRGRSSFVNSAVESGAAAFAGSRTVMPTLRASSGGDALSRPSSAPPAESARPSAAARPPGARAKRHRVRDGDTLTGLSQRYYGDAERYLAIYEANRGLLSNPDLLPIGSELVIPSPDDAAATTASASAAAAPPAARLLPRVQVSPLGEPPRTAE